MRRSFCGWSWDPDHFSFGVGNWETSILWVLVAANIPNQPLWMGWILQEWQRITYHPVPPISIHCLEVPPPPPKGYQKITDSLGSPNWWVELTYYSGRPVRSCIQSQFGWVMLECLQFQEKSWYECIQGILGHLSTLEAKQTLGRHISP